MVVKAVTVATADEGFFRALQQSAQRHGVDLRVLGCGEKWGGFGWKLRKLAEFLEACDPDDLVLCIDAYDVVFLRPLDDLETWYRRHVADGGAPVVSSIEDRGGIGDVTAGVLFGRCRGTLLNAGTYMGTPPALLALLQDMCRAGACDSRDADDQRLLTSACVRRPDLVDIDRGQRLFALWGFPTLRRPGYLRVVDGQLWFRGARPFLLHCPGNLDMSPVLRELGYDGDWHATKRGPGYYVGVAIAQLRYLAREQPLTFAALAALVALLGAALAWAAAFAASRRPPCFSPR